MKIQSAVFWVRTMCSDVVGYQCFRGLYHQLQGEVNMEAAQSFKTLAPYHMKTHSTRAKVIHSEFLN
jgi:hypothetical protein